MSKKSIPNVGTKNSEQHELFFSKGREKAIRGKRKVENLFQFPVLVRVRTPTTYLYISGIFPTFFLSFPNNWKKKLVARLGLISI